MKKVLFAIFGLAAIIACSSSSDDAGPTNTFDRTALLTNWADNIITPAFSDYASKVNNMSDAAVVFNANPSIETLGALRIAWFDAYKAYQYVSMYDIGKAEELSMNITANTYPTDAQGIESNVSTGEYNLAIFSQFDKQGFPALDYLLYLTTDDTSIVYHYTIGPNASGYKQYLTNVIARLKTTADAVAADWNGAYRDEYISKNGNSVSGSVNKTTNLFVKNLEKDIRTGKMGIPAGIFSNGVTYPEKVEAYYSKYYAKELLITAITAQQDFFIGKHFSEEVAGPSLRSYLDFVNATADGQPLSYVIQDKLATSQLYIINLDVNFTQQIVGDNAQMVEAYNKLQEAVVIIKLDMMQALSISIDYVDGDGD